MSPQARNNRDRKEIFLSRPFSWSFDDFLRLPDLWEEGPQGMMRGVAADVYETENDVIVEMAIPGVNPDDITINVTGDTLTISGETEEEKREEKKNYYQKQLRYGSFAQSVVLPTSVQADNAEASFRNGVLKVSIPKSEEAKPKQIKIKIDSSGKK